jgi:hypothetical protein
MVHAATAFSMSVSAKTTMGLLPPSSRETLLRLDLAAAAATAEKPEGRGQSNRKEWARKKRKKAHQPCPSQRYR